MAAESATVAGRRGSSTAPRASRGPRRRRLPLAGLLFAAPWIVGFLVFFLVPIVQSGFYSFTDFNIFQDPKWVGLDNYATMFADNRFYKALFNTLFLAFFGVPFSLAIALGLAMLLNLPVKGQPLYRAVVYVPTVVPLVVAVYVWRWMLNAQNGIINEILAGIGLGRPLWLNDPLWTKPAILLIGFWMIGTTMVIYLAALKDVPVELLEAATIDGAGPFRRFWNVTVPMLAPVTLFQVVVLLIGYLQIFAQPFLLGQVGRNDASLGGPDESMLTYAMLIFQQAFTSLRMGYASALAWFLFLIVLVLTVVIFRLSRSAVNYDR